MTTKHVLNAKTTLTNLDDDCIQPNACDLKLAKVWMMSGKFIIDEDSKVHRSKVEIHPLDDGYFYLEEGSYEISFGHDVVVGDNEAAFVIVRSTLNRNGCFITSGLYDSGYVGPMAACLHVCGGIMVVKPGTRIAQLLVWDAESLHKYAGDYGYNSTSKMDAHLK